MLRSSFFVAALFALGSVAVNVPNVPCTFTAEIDLAATYNDVDYRFRFVHYASTLRKAFAQVGEVPLSYPGNSTIIVHPPNHYTIIQPFFDRSTCVTLPITVSSVECIANIDYDASGQYGVTCPTDRTKKCDVWTYMDAYDADHTIWLLQGTVVPVRVVVDGNAFHERYDFLSWDPSEPPASRFAPEPSLPCTDLVLGGRASASILSLTGSPVSPPIIPDDGLRFAKTLVNDPAEVARTAKSAVGWTAAPAKVFDGVTYAEAARMLRWPKIASRKTAKGTTSTSKNLISDSPVPASFDSREAWPKCNMNAIRAQGSCGSCWAHGAAEALGDRFCIHGGGNVTLSPQWLVSCFKNLDGCDGGYLDVAWDDLVRQGTVTEECFPYEGRNTECPTKCKDGSPLKLFKPKNAYGVYVAWNTSGTVEAIQREIMAHGPVEAAFWVFSDFMKYSSGIYTLSPSAKLAGGHAVKLIGWGEEKGIPYWTLANSWGTSWGEGGFFRIRRGTNEAGIEDEIAAGLPIV